MASSCSLEEENENPLLGAYILIPKGFLHMRHQGAHIFRKCGNKSPRVFVSKVMYLKSMKQMFNMSKEYNSVKIIIEGHSSSCR